MDKLKQEYGKPPSIRSLLLLFTMTALAQLAFPIYSAASLNQAIMPLLLPSFIFISALTIPSIAIGSRLSSKLAINYPPLAPPAKAGLQFAIANGLVLGIALLILRALLQPYLPDELPNYGFRGPIGGLLVSLGAAIAEEVWFRYGLLTLVFYVYLKIANTDRLSQTSALILITLIAIVFGLAHLPQLLTYGADSQFAIWATILGNVAVGILYGWCFFKYGLISAITAHFTLDLVLHVFPALI